MTNVIECNCHKSVCDETRISHESHLNKLGFVKRIYLQSRKFLYSLKMSSENSFGSS